MSKYIQEAIRSKKDYLINELIQMGIYKKGERQLYELTLTELEMEYRRQVNSLNQMPLSKAK
ncbi:MAG: Fur-regulated basic protein FbpA [Bacillus sp. (in: Bacteria)]|nr:Fur-regulated basic protein FbpA [Bacillus sp. (in: firmicutes)]